MVVLYPQTRILRMERGARISGPPFMDGEITGIYHDVQSPWSIAVPHRGLDISVNVGTPLRTPCSGVARVYTWGTFGWWVVVEAVPQWSTVKPAPVGVYSVLAHLSEFLVKDGAWVEAGDIIGLSGGMPGHPGAGTSSGPHCHWESNRYPTIAPGYEVDPRQYCPQEEDLDAAQTQKMIDTTMQSVLAPYLAALGGPAVLNFNLLQGIQNEQIATSALKSDIADRFARVSEEFRQMIPLPPLPDDLLTKLIEAGEIFAEPLTNPFEEAPNV